MFYEIDYVDVVVDALHALRSSLVELFVLEFADVGSVAEFKSSASSTLENLFNEVTVHEIGCVEMYKKSN